MRKPQLCGLRHAEEGKHTQGNADLEINVGICNILDKEVNIFFFKFDLAPSENGESKEHNWHSKGRMWP